MINVKVKSNKDGFMSIEVDGHAHSIICSSVSTLLQSQVRYLQELAKQFPTEIRVEVEQK